MHLDVTTGLRRKQTKEDSKEILTGVQNRLLSEGVPVKSVEIDYNISYEAPYRHTLRAVVHLLSLGRPRNPLVACVDVAFSLKGTYAQNTEKFFGDLLTQYRAQLTSDGQLCT